jgi:hypothetical protein
MVRQLSRADGTSGRHKSLVRSDACMKPVTHLQTNVAMDDDPAAFRAALAEANGFRETELVANRSGRIAGSQYSRLIVEAFRPAIFSGVVLLGWVCVLCFRDLILPAPVLAMVKRAWPFFLLITVATAGAFVLGLARSARLGLQVLLDLKEGETESIAGKVSTYRCTSDEVGVSALFAAKAEHLFYWVGDLKLEVTPSGYELLVKRYDEQFCPPMRIYYTPRSRLLLSAEPLLAMRQSMRQPRERVSIWR